MIISGSGHRPHKLGGYDERTFSRLVELAAAALKKFQPDQVISGMALGWDMALAQAAIQLEVPFIAAVPFKGQESRWPEASQAQYRSLIGLASEVVTVSAGGFSTNKMQLRNIFMADRSDMALVLWDGSSGGTGNFVRYARSKPGFQMVNLWSSWLRFK
jgi:uncharacterized phage-like protein YoqJ